MLASKRRIYLVNGKTDMRKGIDGLLSVIADQGDINLFDPEVMFLFRFACNSL
ncbi:MAG: IS66 family insertion sequence element accessory protein TnpB [Defluviitaleaceae bacterium]|nr:IS66 family insertion sequence element accessory protein TnpB [Defluviitaleaceae bacterium]